jgi:DNA-binding transcriptional LysR family regulator
MELRHLRYFTAVVDCKGYREASRRLHITQPSISQAVSDLEDELGLKLFSRTGRNARLRPEGEIFYADAVGGFRLGLSVQQRSLFCLTSFADTNWNIRT